MTPDELLERLGSLRTGQGAEGAQPHKPLLLLLGLELRGADPGTRLWRYADLEPALRSLLAGSQSSDATPRPQYPFWRLPNDGLWELVDDRARLPLPGLSGDPSPAELRDHVAGGFPAQIFEMLEDPDVRELAVETVLDAYFTEDEREAVRGRVVHQVSPPRTLSTLTSRAAVEAAIAECDALGREAFLAQYGFSPSRRYILRHGRRDYDSKAICGAAFGKQYRLSGPLLPSEFSGGEETVQRRLEALGFSVITSNSEERPVAGLSQILEEVLAALATEGPTDSDRLRELVTREGQHAVQKALPGGWQAKGSVGQGNLATVPWIGVFAPGMEPSAKRGFYVVYLFRADGGGVYLSLNQATSQLKPPAKGGRVEVLRKRALDLRVAAGLEGGPAVLALGADSGLPRLYAEGNAEEVFYERGAVPDDTACSDDIERFLSLHTRARETGLDFDPEFEPLHVLLKWASDFDPETVTKHKDVADREGFTWWGKMGKTSLAPAVVRGLQAQIESHPGQTHAYLYGGQELWRTELIGITTDSADVDDRHYPAYYDRDECTAFFRLAGFERLPRSAALEGLVLATKPNPEDLPGALGNQTNPLYVFERAILGAAPEPSDADESEEPIEEPPTALTMEWLEEETLWPSERLEEVIEALRGTSPQVVLAGPPGTGKTWVAERIARYLTKDQASSREVVQFHPSYGYEEFIEGIRPVAKDGAISFERQPGVVLRMANQMQAGDEPRVLVIDEMNRANLPRVFGELMYLFEYRETPVNLMYTPDFSLPERLLFIGTMNTADRSIRSIDVALRRRFEVFECRPDANILARFFETRTNQIPDLIEGFEALNTELTKQLDRHHTIGHTFFMVEEMTPARLSAAWERKIFPLIEEYFFDQPDLAAEFSLERFWASLAP